MQLRTCNRTPRALWSAGGVAVAAGTAIAIAPRSFIDTEPTADLLSEPRTPGAALLALGVFMLAAAIRRRQLRTAALTATIIELAIGIASLATAIASNESSPTGENVR